MAWTCRHRLPVFRDGRSVRFTLAFMKPAAGFDRQAESVRITPWEWMAHT